MSRLNSFAPIQQDLNEYDPSRDCLLSVVRNPVDSVVSNTVVGIHDIEGFSLNQDSDNSNLRVIANRIVKNYSITLNTIYANSDIIIDFNDLVSRPDDVMNAIATKLDIPITNQGQEVEVVPKAAKGKRTAFYPSSEVLPNYDLVKDLVSQMPIYGGAINAYNRVLSKAIVI